MNSDLHIWQVRSPRCWKASSIIFRLIVSAIWSTKLSRIRSSCREKKSVSTPLKASKGVFAIEGSCRWGEGKRETGGLFRMRENKKKAYKSDVDIPRSGW